MADLTGIQPNNLTTMPTGNAIKSIASGVFRTRVSRSLLKKLRKIKLILVN